MPADAAYLYQKETKYIPYGPDLETVTTFRDRLDGLMGNLIAGEFPARESFNCRRCDYREICERGST